MQTKTVRAPIVKARTNGSGQFEALIHAFERDLDGERFENFTNVPGRFPLRYQHLNFFADESEGAIEDPGAEIGTVKVTLDRRLNALRLDGQLDLSNPMAQGVYERMMLDPGERLALSEFSVGFEFNAQKSYYDTEGTRVLVDGRLLEVSVVWRGAQRTELVSVKAAREREFPHRDENGERYMVAASGEWVLYESGRMIRLDGAEDPGRKSASSVDDDLRDALDEIEFGAKSASASEDVAADVDALIRSVRAEKAKDDADRAAFLDANRALATGASTWDPIGEAERAREKFEREEADRARRDAEKAAEADLRDLADEARRDADWHAVAGGLVHWKSVDRSVPQQDDGPTYRLPIGGHS
jgi:hypothetical protein